MKASRHLYVNCLLKTTSAIIIITLRQVSQLLQNKKTINYICNTVDIYTGIINNDLGTTSLFHFCHLETSQSSGTCKCKYLCNLKSFGECIADIWSANALLVRFEQVSVEILLWYGLFSSSALVIYSCCN